MGRNYDFSHWGELPMVSCQCITFGRTYLLDEAVESFLRQDYPGPKELVILNDYPPLQIECFIPGIRVINQPFRYGTIGEKRNECARLSRGHVLMVWDDDDISLPHRISYSIAQMKDKEFHLPERWWDWRNEELTAEPVAMPLHAAGAWSKALFEQMGGYKETQSGHDRHLLERFAAIGKKPAPVEPGDIHMLYRSQGTGSYHLSKWPEGGGYKEISQFVRAHHFHPTHRITPRWFRDYAALAEGASARKIA